MNEIQTLLTTLNSDKGDRFYWLHREELEKLSRLIDNHSRDYYERSAA